MDYHNYTVDELATDPSFIRWVKGDDTDAKQFWENWQQQHPQKSAEVQQARQLVLLFLSNSTSTQYEASSEEIANAKNYIRQKIQTQPVVDPPRPSPRITPHFYRWAAIITLLVTSSLTFWWLNTPVELTTYQTEFGKTRTIVLSDQSVVTLNANSILKAPEVWQNGQPRNVWLSGEAFFEITTQPDASDQRFIVHTDVVDVQVLGTKFNLRQRRQQAEVVLTEGKVTVNSSTDSRNEATYTMLPGDRLQTQGQNFIKSQVDVEKYISWRHNRLFFEEQTLREIAKRLEDDYGLQTKFDNYEIATMVFTGSCPTDNLSVLYEALSVALDLKIHQENQLLIINNNHNQ